MVHAQGDKLRASKITIAMIAAARRPLPIPLVAASPPPLLGSSNSTSTNSARRPIQNQLKPYTNLNITEMPKDTTVAVENVPESKPPTS